MRLATFLNHFALLLSALLVASCAENPWPRSTQSPSVLAEVDCPEFATCLEQRPLVPCRFVCRQSGDDGSTTEADVSDFLPRALKVCSKGTLAAVGGDDLLACLIESTAQDDALDRPELRLELEHVVLRQGLTLPAARLRTLRLVDTVIEGEVDLSDAVFSEELVIEHTRACGAISLEGASVQSLGIRESQLLASVQLGEVSTQRNLELTDSFVCGSVDASGLQAGGNLLLANSQFHLPGTTRKKVYPADFEFCRLSAATLEVTQVTFVGSTSFDQARVTGDVDFRHSSFHGFVTAGAITTQGALSFEDVAAPGSEGALNPWWTGSGPCIDRMKGTSFEMYRTKAALIDLRGMRTEGRLVNLNESATDRLDLGTSTLCGLLLSGTKAGVVNIDEPGRSEEKTGIADTDARGFAFEHLVSRSEDPVSATQGTFGRIAGARQLFMQLSAQLHESGQFEQANSAYLIAQETESRPYDPSWYIFWLSGDGRYPLWGYGLAFIVLYLAARFTFHKRPNAWEKQREGVAYSAAWFALDVVTPDVLDLGYRGVEVFGNDKRRAFLHSVFHVLGLIILSMTLIAIGVRLP
jgi:hypothetical protein